MRARTLSKCVIDSSTRETRGEESKGATQLVSNGRGELAQHPEDEDGEDEGDGESKG